MSNNQYNSNERIYYIPEYQSYLSNNDIPNTDLPAVLAIRRFKSIDHAPVKGKIKIKYIGKK